MGIVNTLLRAITWWNGQTLNTQIFTWRKGEKVGEDDQGNIYYRTKNDSKRWVIYNGEAEASRVGPDFQTALNHIQHTKIGNDAINHTGASQGQGASLKNLRVAVFVGVVNRIITNLGVLDVVEGGLKIVETADGVSEDELRAATEAHIVN